MANGLTLGATLLTVAAGVFAAMQAAHAQTEPGTNGLPEEFDTAACHALAQEAGGMIAWARWEQNIAEEVVSTVEFHEDTPGWVVGLVNHWIDDAYHWKITDEQLNQWAHELGVEAPAVRSDQLTKHQTIAIWLRRIARQCDELHLAAAR
jgi:hypothetical protein